MKTSIIYILGFLLLQSCFVEEKVKSVKLSDLDFNFLKDSTKNFLSSNEIEDIYLAKNRNLGILSISKNGNYQLVEQDYYKTKPISKIDLNLVFHDVDNVPYEVTKINRFQISDTSFQVEEESKYYASNLLTIQNLSKDTIGLEQIDNQLLLLQEAKDENGEWKLIEYFDYDKCGNSYWKTSLPPKQVVLVQLPRYSGNFETYLRVKLKSNDKIFYSDSIKSRINKSQFNLSEKSFNYKRLVRKFRKSKVDSLVFLK
ncbi:hypothetical protein [Flammeovirga agarivorans]|uniref:Lipoprotein n=1 Tax=Flammeovirga agarivorans TaxID=2726742 RepID=A0A7X8SRL6_9BACT|nr:hypothetical protein [Flammeovirga agarivorans]NLR95113.1 hypothetical protein [Flammeovirga agarivorans]